MVSVVGLFLQVAGGALLLDGAVSAWRGHQSLRWPTTQGRIVVSKVATLPRASDPRFGTAPRVRYEYEVDGRTYFSHRIDFGGWWSAWNVVEEHPVGTTWTVSYDPEDPGRAVLEPGVRGVSVLELYLGLAVVVGGVLLALGIWWLPGGEYTPTAPPL